MILTQALYLRNNISPAAGVQVVIQNQEVLGVKAQPPERAEDTLPPRGRGPPRAGASIGKTPKSGRQGLAAGLFERAQAAGGSGVDQHQAESDETQGWTEHSCPPWRICGYVFPSSVHEAELTPRYRKTCPTRPLRTRTYPTSLSHLQCPPPSVRRPRRSRRSRLLLLRLIDHSKYPHLPSYPVRRRRHEYLSIARVRPRRYSMRNGSSPSCDWR